jgi:hypothetical protein
MVRPDLVHGGDVERREKVDVGEARVREVLEVLHAVAVRAAERAVRAAQRGRDRGVVDREVPDVELVQRDRLGGGQGRLAQ